MRTCIVLFAVGLSLAWTAPARAQGQAAKSPADVLPANVLAYVEVQKPGQVAKEVRELFKGSVLYNVPDSMAELEAKHPDVPFYMTGSYKMLGLLIAPEAVKEMAKGQGGAVALLSIRAGKAGKVEKEAKGRKTMAPSPEVEFVFIIQPGASNFPAYLTRTMLVSAPVKVKETVAGVKIYRVYSIEYGFKPDKDDEDGKDGGLRRTMVTRETDPSFAMMKDYIFIGSYQAVKDCVLRAKDKAEGESLAENKDFQAAHKKLGGAPGLFAFGSVTSLLDASKEMAKDAPPGLAVFLAAYEKLLNPKAFHGVGVSLSLQKGTIHFQEFVPLNATEKSPLLDLYPTKPVRTDVLHFAPRQAILAVAISNAEGGERWDKLLQMADDLVPAIALGGQKVSAKIHDVEKKLGKNIGKDVLDKITTVGFAMGNPLFAPQRTKTVEGPDFTERHSTVEAPMLLLLETTDDQAAQTVTELLAKVGALVHKNAKLESKTIKDQTVAVIVLQGEHHLAYGTAGKVVVIGRSAEAVAHALADGVARKGLASDPKVMAALKEAKKALAVSLSRPASLAVSPFLMGSTRSSYEKKEEKRIKDDKDKEGDKGKDGPPQTKTTITTRKDRPAEAERKKAWRKIMAEEPWLVTTVTRGKDYFQQEGKSYGWEKFVPKLVNFGAEQIMESSKPRMKEKKEKFEDKELDFKKERLDKEERPAEKKEGELKQALLRPVPSAREQTLLTPPASGSLQVDKKH